MNKFIKILIVLVVATIITFLTFEGLSWYHLGDTPTVVVIVRLFLFYSAVVGTSFKIISHFDNNKKE